MSGITGESLKAKLGENLQATHVEVVDMSDGCGLKFEVVVVSSLFEGKPLLSRHRLVNQCLSEEMEHIHAFSQKTYTPEQWEKRKSSS